MKSPQQLIAEVRNKVYIAAPEDCWGGFIEACDNLGPATKAMLREAPTDLALLTDCLSVALEKLAEVQSKVGMCIYGSSDTSHDPEVAYRQGSYQAWCDTGSIAKEALIDITELIAKRGKA